MIQRRAVSRFSVCALVVVALSSTMLLGCGAGDDPVEGAGQPPFTFESGVAVTSTSAQTVGDDATSDQGSGEGDSGDESDGGDHEDDFGVSSTELEELERTLDEIDQLIADLERDLAAD